MFKAPDGAVIDSAAYSTTTSGYAYERVDLRQPWNAAGNVVLATASIDGTNFGTPSFVASSDITKALLRAPNAPTNMVLVSGPAPDITALLGSTVDLHLLSPGHGGAICVIAASMGTTPGIAIGSMVLGINADALFIESLATGSPFFSAFGGGVLDAHGASSAAVHVPNVAALSGINIYVAFIVLDITLALVRDSTVATLTLAAPAPLSSVVALSCDGAAAAAMGLSGISASSNAAEFVKALVHATATNPALLSPNATNPAGIEFPLTPAFAEVVRNIPGFTRSRVVSWLDAIGATAASAPRLGANCDYLAWFGDNWNAVSGDAPQFNGAGNAGWLWVNHEYLSGGVPSTITLLTGSALIFALWLMGQGVITGNPLATPWTLANVDAHNIAHKKELGGSWLRAVQAANGAWSVAPSAAAQRYDATSNTLFRITGYTPHALDHDDNGAPLPVQIASGTFGN